MMGIITCVVGGRGCTDTRASFPGTRETEASLTGRGHFGLIDLTGRGVREE